MTKFLMQGYMTVMKLNMKFLGLTDQFKTYFDQELRYYIESLQNDKAKELLVQNSYMKVYDNYGDLLIYATQCGNEMIIQHLIDLGANIDYKAQDKKTPLKIALEFCRPHCIRFLLEAKAKNITSVSDNCALQIVYEQFKTEFDHKLRAYISSYRNSKAKKMLGQDRYCKIYDNYDDLLHYALLAENEVIARHLREFGARCKCALHRNKRRKYRRRNYDDVIVIERNHYYITSHTNCSVTMKSSKNFDSFAQFMISWFAPQTIMGQVAAEEWPLEITEF